MLKTRDIPNVEILSPGRWKGSGCPPGGALFTEDDLDRLASTYKAGYQPPIKLGHDENQKLLQSDGYPAAGWLSNIRTDVVDGVKRLFADLVRVPEKIAALMEVGAYRNRSVELHGDLVTGLALLGADLPAVENLNDIMAWYSRQFSLDDDEKMVVFTSNPEPPTVCCAASKSPHWQAGRDPHDQTCENFPAPQRTLLTYVDNAEHVLTDVQAFVERTEQLAALRAREGRSFAIDKHRERLASLRDGLRDAQARLDAFVEEPAPPAPIEPDYRPLMRARARLAEMRVEELAGATT